MKVLRESSVRLERQPLIFIDSKSNLQPGHSSPQTSLLRNGRVDPLAEFYDQARDDIDLEVNAISCHSCCICLIGHSA